MKLRFLRFVSDILHTIKWRIGLWLCDLERYIYRLEYGEIHEGYSLEELDAQVQADMAKMGRFPRD